MGRRRVNGGGRGRSQNFGDANPIRVILESQKKKCLLKRKSLQLPSVSHHITFWGGCGDKPQLVTLAKVTRDQVLWVLKDYSCKSLPYLFFLLWKYGKLVLYLLCMKFLHGVVNGNVLGKSTFLPRFGQVFCVSQSLIIFVIFAKVCPSLPRFAQVCPGLPKFAQVCPSLPRFAQVCPSLLWFAKVCSSVSKFAKVWAILPRFA